MLDALENKVIAKLIGLLNGLDEFPLTNDVKEDIKDILMDVKEKKNLEKDLEILDSYKHQFLSNCFTCVYQCGRTNDYFLNSIENEELKEKRINDYKEFINNYTKDMDFDEIAYNLCKLSW